MKIIQSSDYLIYFDDVRMDPYIKNWSCSVGLSINDASASISMYKTRELEQWKGYLTQVRIFALNVFSGKYCMVFEGEITNRSWSDARVDTGEITFRCSGFYHWLSIPIPLLISYQDDLNHITRFKYEAQNINVEAFKDVNMSRHELMMKDKALQELLDTLFSLLYNGYYLNKDSAFEWADLKGRFKVMSEVIKEFREAGFLDAFTYTRTTQIDSFMVYLNQIITQMMMEFYQDRDGALRIKSPSWKDVVLQAHVLDEAVVQSASGFNSWENEPTRVLVIGGKEDYGNTGTGDASASVVEVPMGLYIGQPGEGKYFNQNITVTQGAIGVNPDGSEISPGGEGDVSGSAEVAAYYLSEKEFRLSTPFAPGGINDGWHENGHNGIDLARPGAASILGKAIYSLTDGEVVQVLINNATAGNGVHILAPSGYKYRYIHMQSAPPVKKGDKVRAGQTIGQVGSTGRSSGPHLDLKIQKPSGGYIDPIPHMKKMLSSGSSDGSGNIGGGIAGLSASSTASSGPSDATVSSLVKQDLKNQSNWTAAQLNNWINSKGKTNSKMHNRGAAFYEAGRATGLDPLYLISHAAHETGWGTSNIVRNKNNFYGIAAFDATPYSSAKTWTGADAGIIQGAIWIKKNYYNAGQTTLHSMRFSKSGTHNYATDTEWHTKIAAIWKGANPAAGEAGTPGEGGIGDTGSPNAATGGFTVSTAYSTSYKKDLLTGIYSKPTTGATDRRNSQKGLINKPLSPVKYNNSFRILYPFTYNANNYKSLVTKQPNGVPADMIASIIEVASGWKEKNDYDGRYGLMGVSSNYVKLNNSVTKKDMLKAEKNIEHGTQFFKNAYEHFGNKVTFALASLYIGDRRKVEEAIVSTGKEDFSKVRAKLEKVDDGSGVGDFVDKVINRYAGLYGADYIQGDPHIIIFKDNSILRGVDDSVVADNDAVKDYQSVYKPIMSDEERMYKVKLQVSEQPLIRYELTPNVNQPLSADELVERYAKYMMQLFRAESHGVTVNMTTCLPFLRPGFNMWLEPTRHNLVFYPTRIQHQGSFGNGAFTSVSGAFVRDMATFDDIEDNIFVTQQHDHATGFGDGLSKAGMLGLQQQLRKLHNNNDETIGDARTVPILNKIYSSTRAISQEHSTDWTNEMTAKQIQQKITSLYSKAPKIIVTRKTKLKSIINDAESFFTKMLLKTMY